VASEKYLWWETPLEKSLDTELWRRPRGAERPDEHLATLTGSTLLAALDDRVLWLEREYVFEWLAIRQFGGEPVQYVASRSASGFGSANAEAFFYEGSVVATGIYWIQRFSSDGSEVVNLTPGGIDARRLSMQPREPWVVWAAADETGFTIGRTRIDLALPHEVITELHEGAYTRGIALTPKDDIVVYDQTEQRLFRIKMPDFPCAEGIACPAGYVCQPDDLCHRND